MLMNIDPILIPDLLWCLRAMGHGDDIVIVDANFPAESTAEHSSFGSVIRLPETDTAGALRAILSVMPLDTFVPSAVGRMEVVGNPSAIPAVIEESQAMLDEMTDQPQTITSYERHAFYEATRGVFAIVQTGEPRGYGNLILKKGVLLADQKFS